MIDNDLLEEQLGRVQRSALLVGLTGVAASMAMAPAEPALFFRSYLVAFLFWLGLPLGCLVIVMIHHLAGGRWGYSVRRLLEAGTRTLPLMALLFLPLLAGLRILYVWARPEAVAADELLQHKQIYLNLPFFLGRAVFYFAVWCGLARLLDRAATMQDRAPGPDSTKRLMGLSAGGLLAYGLTMTFAAVDWAMSLEPHWFSTVYGVRMMTGQVLSGFALMIIVGSLLARQEPLSDVIRPMHFHDLGNFLLTFVIFWAYISFSQFLITWAGNLPEETIWYLHRFRGGWGRVGICLVVLHFFVPFFLLLSRDVKRNPMALAAVALGVLAMCVVDLFWIVAPGFGGNHIEVHWTNLTALIGIGGLWVAAFVRQLTSRTLVPVHDARMEEALR